MAGPQITLSLVDPGAAKNPVESDQIPVYVDICSQGSLTEVKRFSRSASIEAEFGVGHLVDLGKHHLATGNKEVRLLRVAASTPGVAAGGDIGGALIDTVNNTPVHYLAVTVEITVAGAGAISGGDYEAKYSLDDYGIANVVRTESQSAIVPASGIITLGTTGLTVTLQTANSPAVGDSASFTTTPGEYDATAVAAARTQLTAAVAGDYTYIVYGGVSTAALANTQAVAIEAELLVLFGQARFVSALCDGGLEADTVLIAAIVATASDPPFLSMGYGATFVSNPTAEIARGRMSIRQHQMAASIISRLKISTDPARTASGALPRAVGTDYDAAEQGDALHDARVSVMRTWEPASQGLFIQRQRLLSAAISNFTTWPHAAVMVAALRAAHRVAFLIIADTLRKNPDGTMDARDRASIDSAVNVELERTLLTPLNVRGNQGHASSATGEVVATTLLPAVDIDIRISSVEFPDDVTFTLQYV